MFPRPEPMTMRVVALFAIAVFVVTSALATSPYGRTLFRFVNDIPGADKTGHFVVIGLVTLPVVLGFARARVFGHRLGSGLCLLLVALVVTFEECSQQLLPNRSFSLIDLAFSYAGLAVFGAIATWIEHARSRPRPAQLDRSSL